MELVVPKQYVLQSFDKKCVFHFAEGIPGFENARDWIILASQSEEPFAWLQSVSVPNLSFVVVDPWLICQGYTARISEFDLKRLDIKSKEDVLLLSIVSVKDRIEDMTANLVGPVLINVKARKGAQIVLQNSNDYPAAYGILNGIEQPDRSGV